jgi:hypothetical protein
MIKDIGIEVLRAGYIEPTNPLDLWATGQAAFILPQGCKMEMIDVTGIDDTGVEPVLIEGFSGSAMIKHLMRDLHTGNQGTM